MKQLFYRFGHLFELGTSEQFQVYQHLVVARTSAMNLLTHITQLASQHQLHLRMYIFYAIFYNKFTLFGRNINILHLGQQSLQLPGSQQTDTLQHRDMGHRTQDIMFRQIKVHLTVTSYGKTVNLIIYPDTLFP